MKSASILTLPLAIILTLLLTFKASAIELKEGVHYTKISDKHVSGAEVTEYFSYFCPHCYNHEPFAKQLESMAEDGTIKFNKSHVDFIRVRSAETQVMLSKATAMASILGKSRITTDIFKEIHTEHNVIDEEEDLQKIFEANGISKSEFESAINSFAVVTKARRMKDEQESLSKGGHLVSVPTFIVNGKYQILGDGFKATNANEYFAQLKEAVIQLSKLN